MMQKWHRQKSSKRRVLSVSGCREIALTIPTFCFVGMMFDVGNAYITFRILLLATLVSELWFQIGQDNRQQRGFRATNVPTPPSTTPATSFRLLSSMVRAWRWRRCPHLPGTVKQKLGNRLSQSERVKAVKVQPHQQTNRHESPSNKRLCSSSRVEASCPCRPCPC